MPYLPAVFKKKRDHKLSSNSEQVEASAQQITLQVTPGGTPSYASQPWHYVFQNGDEAWALGVNGLWRLVMVIGEGFLENIDNRKQLTYNATWINNGEIMRGTFSPGCGNIKPNTLTIRRLLFDEGPRHIEERDWEEVKDDYLDESDVEFGESEESESEHQELVFQ